MRKIVLLSVLCLFQQLCADEAPIAVSTQATERVAIHAILCSSEQGDPEYVAQLCKALEFSGHCRIVRDSGSLPTHRDMIKAQREAGYPLVLYLQPHEMYGYSWRLYDTATGQMLGGKRYAREGNKEQSIVLRAADDIYQLLQGKRGPFLSRIAYVRTKADPITRAVSSVLCTTAYDGSDIREEVVSRHVLVAPFFHPAGYPKCLFYSEFTPTNVRIMATDCAGNSRAVVDRDGTHVGVGMSLQRPEVVYCSSGQIWQCKYDPIIHRAAHRMMVDRVDGAPCASPNLLPDGSYIFCAGGTIYQHDPTTHSTVPLTSNCYAVSPYYSPGAQGVAYARRVQGIFQIFWYDCVTHTHTQITAGSHDKADPAVSPCGNYVIYVREEGKTSRIIIEHRNTHMQHAVTSSGVRCAYPAWSPFYTD